MRPFYAFRRCWEAVSFVYWHLVNLRSFICFLLLAEIWLIWYCQDNFRCIITAVTKQTEYLCTYRSGSFNASTALYNSFCDQQNNETWFRADLFLSWVFRAPDSPFSPQCFLWPLVSAISAAHNLLSILLLQEASRLAPS